MYLLYILFTNFCVSPPLTQRPLDLETWFLAGLQILNAKEGFFVTQGQIKKSPRLKRCAIARCEVYFSMYITYIWVSIPTPWTVTGPNWQLASYILCWNDIDKAGLASNHLREKRKNVLILVFCRYARIDHCEFAGMNYLKKKAQKCNMWSSWKKWLKVLNSHY